MKTESQFEFLCPKFDRYLDSGFVAYATIAKGRKTHLYQVVSGVTPFAGSTAFGPYDRVNLVKVRLRV